MVHGPDGLPAVRRVVLDDDEVAYVELGNRAGRPVVLLAGLTDGLAPVTQARTRAMLADVPLPMARLRCLALSHPCRLDPPPSTQQLAASAAAALRQLLDSPAVVVAHSLGAMVAQHLAVDAPELVAALVLSATSARADDDLRELLARWDGWLRNGRADEFARDALDASFTGKERDRRRTQLDTDPLPTPPPALIERHLALSQAAGTHDALQRLAGIRVPTLALAGERDRVMPARHTRRLADRIPQARLEVLPGVGHAFPEQCPERFEALVLEFLDGVVASSRPVADAARPEPSETGA